MSTYADDKFDYIERDIDKIKMKPGMYISYAGERGAVHLAKELIQNAIDECENKKSPCRNIDIILDTKADRLTVEDDGRGFPETDVTLDTVCTTLQSGSKFNRVDGSTSGENGISRRLKIIRVYDEPVPLYSDIHDKPCELRGEVMMLNY